jgi:hypothetical protein
VVTGDWSAEAAELVAAGQVDGLTLNYAKGYRERSLDFIGDWPIRRLDVLARTIKDLEPIYRLSATLEDLGLTTAPTAVLDCARLPRLTSLAVENWGQIRESLPSAHGLKELGVYGYLERDLLPVTDNALLETIRIAQAPRLESLLGAQMLSKLTSLTVVAARNLTDLTSLSGTGARIRRLDLTSCKSIGGLEAVSPLVGLQYLSIANCSHIASLRPLQAMAELENIQAYESTRIDDGDLTPLLGLTNLRDLRMKNRENYKPTVAEVKQHLGLKE